MSSHVFGDLTYLSLLIRNKCYSIVIRIPYIKCSIRLTTALKMRIILKVLINELVLSDMNEIINSIDKRLAESHIEISVPFESLPTI